MKCALICFSGWKRNLSIFIHPSNIFYASVKIGTAAVSLTIFPFSKMSISSANQKVIPQICISAYKIQVLISDGGILIPG